MKIPYYREHLRLAHACPFVVFDLFSQPYQCHYCTVCCASWQGLLTHMNTCRLTFNMNDNCKPNAAQHTTLAVNQTRKPNHLCIDRHLHAENLLYQYVLKVVTIKN